MQRVTKIGDPEAEPGPPSPLAVSGRPGDRQPLRSGVTRHCVQAVPVGVPLPSQLHPLAVQQPVTSKEQYQLPGHIHDKRGTLLRGTPDLRRDGDVPCGAAALSQWKSLSLYLRLLCGDCYVSRDGDCCPGARLAVVLHEEAIRLLVRHYSGKEEEMINY